MSFASFILLTVLLTVAAQNDDITLIQRRTAQLKQLNYELENIGARKHEREFKYILKFLRAGIPLEDKMEQTSKIAAPLSDPIKKFVERLTVAVDKQLKSYRAIFATSSSQKAKYAMENLLALTIDINVLLDLNGQLSKMEKIINQLEGDDLAEFRKLDNQASA